MELGKEVVSQEHQNSTGASNVHPPNTNTGSFTTPPVRQQGIKITNIGQLVENNSVKLQDTSLPDQTQQSVKILNVDRKTGQLAGNNTMELVKQPLQQDTVLSDQTQQSVKILNADDSMYDISSSSVHPIGDLKTIPSVDDDFYKLVDDEKLKQHEFSWDGISDRLRVGLTFQSRTLVKKFLSIYGERSLCNMVVTMGGATDGCKSRQVSQLLPSSAQAPAQLR